jgi:hypothetical protein
MCVGGKAFLHKCFEIVKWLEGAETRERVWRRRSRPPDSALYRPGVIEYLNDEE